MKPVSSMDEKPRFEIVEQIGHGQFSIVYKARWINRPLVPEPAVGEAQLPFLQQQQPDYQHQNLNTRQVLRSPFELNSQSVADASYLHQQREAGKQAGSKNKTNIADKYVALKRIKFYDMQNSKMRMDYVKEVRLLQQLKHPNIINYNISFIERNELFIVLELADGGDLSKLIRYFHKRKQLLTEQAILKYFTQVCSAVRYIHSKRILHRDIKPANIFMTSDGCVKLGDFGLGRFFSQNTRDAHTIVGTFYYMSPERIRESGYGFSSDIWSLGCVLYELITLSSPFSILNLEQQKQQQVARQRQQFSTEQSGKQVQMNRNLQPHHQGQAQLLNHYNQTHQTKNQQQQPPTPMQHQQSPYNLQWLIERILRADYPALDAYTDISLRLRTLTTECLNPNPDERPDMDFICSVVGEAYSPPSLTA